MDAVNYKNGQKNQWRRTVWRLIKIYAQPGPILYLPGSTDLDREEAIRKGFKPADLIAIERDVEVASHLRSKGVTTICGSLNDVLLSWPTDVRIGGLIADLQCGLDWWVVDLAGVVKTHPSLVDAVIVCNLQRGRDPNGKPILSLVRKINSKDADGRNPLFNLDAGSHPSRAPAFFHLAKSGVESQAEWLSRVRDLKAPGVKLRETQDRLSVAIKQSPQGLEINEKNLRLSLDRSEAVRALDEALKLSDAAHRRYQFCEYPRPYKSTPSSPYFDSVVFISTGVFEERLAAWEDRPRPLRGQIAAALALRTRRLRGELNGGRHKAA